MKSIILVVFFLSVFSGFSTNKDNATIPTVNEALSSAVQEPQCDQSEMIKYFEYLDIVPTTTLFMSDDAEKEGFNDDVILAFSVSFDIAESENFDFSKGVTKERIDEISNKYFGRTVFSYNSKFTYVLDNGNVASTGWSPSAYSYVLKEITDLGNNKKKAVFYQIGAHYENMTYEEYLEKMKIGDFSKFGKTGLVEMIFNEYTDDKNEFYLQFLDAQHLDTASLLNDFPY